MSHSAGAMRAAAHRVEILAVLAALWFSEAGAAAAAPNENCGANCNSVGGSTTSLLLIQAKLAQESTSATQITYAGRPANLHQAAAGHYVKLKRPAEGAYNLLDSSDVYFSQWGQERKLWDPVLERIDGLRQKGYKPFFVESGARDGEEHSNTLYLERNMHWGGLLVEPSNQEFPKLLTKGRKSWAFHGALSPTNSSTELEFFDDGQGTSHLEDKGQGPEAGLDVQEMRTPAEPLAALLGKIQPPVNTVDFWSLDIEGSEGPVLESTDFTKVEVGVLMIEMNKGSENNARIQKVMHKNGFQDIGGTTYDGGILDHVFINSKYFEKRGLEVPKPFGQV